MSNQVKKDIELLNNGILPKSLYFGSDKDMVDIDIYKLAYNLRYKNTDYWLSKFPSGFENLPGSDRIIDSITEKSLSPIEELDIRALQSCLINPEDKI